MKSLRRQLTVRLLLGGALLLGAAGAMLHWQVRHALNLEFDNSLLATAQSLAALTEQHDGRVKMEMATDINPQFEEPKGAEVFLLCFKDGREIKRSLSLGKAILPTQAASKETPLFSESTLPDGRVLRCVQLLFSPQEEESTNAPRVGAQMIVGRDRAPLINTLASLRAALVLVGSGSLAALAALVAWGVRGGLLPLDRLGEKVAAVNATSLATRFAIDPLPTELQPIASRLNELLARLDSAFARERRFTATAAHEFRTPLAELRALAEVNLTTPATEQERMESWRDALAATLGMEALAVRLLELARAENPTPGLASRTIHLAEALSEAWRPWTRQAASRGVVLTASIPSHLVVESDPVLLSVILSNLCANAAEHASAGAHLSVNAKRESGNVQLTFCNATADLTEEDTPYLFERFWRKDKARTDCRHHGLGLALASDFAKILGGGLSAKIGTGGVLEISLWIPDLSLISNKQATSARDE